MQKTHTQTYYDRYSPEYDTERTNTYFSYLTQEELRILTPYAQGKNVLEVGCGTGLVLQAVRPLAHTCTGIDISEGMLARARHKGLHVHQASATALPFADASFDTVYSFKVLPHIENIQKALQEISRVTKPGGVCVLEFYNPLSIKRITGSLFNIIHKKKVYLRYDTPRNIQAILPNALRIERIHGIRSFLPFAGALRIPFIGNLFLSAEREFAPKKIASYHVYILRKTAT